MQICSKKSVRGKSNLSRNFRGRRLIFCVRLASVKRQQTSTAIFEFLPQGRAKAEKAENTFWAADGWSGDRKIKLACHCDRVVCPIRKKGRAANSAHFRPSYVRFGEIGTFRPVSPTLGGLSCKVFAICRDRENFGKSCIGRPKMGRIGRYLHSILLQGMCGCSTGDFATGAN